MNEGTPTGRLPSYNLTLTRVVFEFSPAPLGIILIFYLTLTRVVFELSVIHKNKSPFDLTLTRVVFEWTKYEAG